MRTRRSTCMSSSIRNAQLPSTYCNGSPSARRSTMSAQRRYVSAFDASSRWTTSSAPRHPLASSTMRRAADPSSRRPASASSARHVGPSVTRVAEPPRLLVVHERVGDLVELTGEDPVELVQRQVDAVIGDAVVLVVVRADLFAPTATADLTAPRLRRLRLLTVLLELQQSGTQHLQRLRPVLDLALLVLHGDDEARRLVRDAHCGVGRVHRLPTRTGRAVHVDLQVALVDGDVDLLRLGEHRHR